MAIHIEFYDQNEEYNNIVYKEPFIIDNYFNFDYNDIDLNSFFIILNEGKHTSLLKEYRHIPEHLLKKMKFKEEERMGINEQIEKNVYEDFKEIYSKISDCFLNLNAYPYYKNTIYDLIKFKIVSYKDDEFKEIYFFILFLSKRKCILGKIYEFYKKKFFSNFDNPTNLFSQANSVSNLLPYFSESAQNSNENDITNNNPNIANTLTVDIIKSEKFREFCCGLSKWYSLAETITLNLGILNEFFGFTLEFSQEKFALNNNFGFSLETFAKKNILKLISYFLKKMTIDVNFSDFNYKRFLLIFASAFTCGIPLRDFLFKDMKQFALIGGVVFNIIIGKIATNIENYSNTLDFSRLMTILNKLNKKLTIIEKKLYKILKSSLRTKLLEYVGVYPHNKQIEKIIEKKKVFSEMISKYLKGTETFNDEEENKLLKESIMLSQDIEKSIKSGKTIDETWVYLNIKNKSDENKDQNVNNIDIDLSIISKINKEFK